MTVKKPGPLSRFRDHYDATRSEHRPLPVLLPFGGIALIAIAAFLLLDNLAAGMRGKWPAWLADGALFVTDVGRSWWIITLATIVILAGSALQRLSKSERIGRVMPAIISNAFYILLSVGLASLIVNIVKRAIGRPRPTIFDDHGLFSFNPFQGNFDFESFPSGHATVNGALFMALSLLFPAARVPLLLAGLCLALTRVLIGVHFPSDVVAGFGFGMWFAFAMAMWFSRFGLVFGHQNGRLLLRK